MRNPGNLYSMYEILLDQPSANETWPQVFLLNVSKPGFQRHLREKDLTGQLWHELENLVEIGWIELLGSTGKSEGNVMIRITCPPTHGLRKCLEFRRRRGDAKEVQRLSKKIVHYEALEDKEILPYSWRAGSSEGKNPSLLYRPPTDALYLMEDLLVGRRDIAERLGRIVDENDIIACVGQAGVGKTKLIGWFLRRLLKQKDIDLTIYWTKLASSSSIVDIVTDFLVKAQDKVAVETESEQLSWLPSSRDEVFFRFVDLLQSHPYLIVLDNFERVLEGVSAAPAEHSTMQLFDTLAESTIGQSRIILGSRWVPRGKMQAMVECLEIPGFSKTETRQFLFELGITLEKGGVDSVVQISAGNPLALKLGRQRWLAEDYNRADDQIDFGSVMSFVRSAFQGLDSSDQALLRVVLILSEHEHSTLKAVEGVAVSYLGWEAEEVRWRVESLADTKLLLKRSWSDVDKDSIFGAHALLEHHVLMHATSEAERAEIHRHCMEHFLVHADREDMSDVYWLSAALHAASGGHHDSLSSILFDFGLDLQLLGLGANGQLMKLSSALFDGMEPLKENVASLTSWAEAKGLAIDSTAAALRAIGMALWRLGDIVEAEAYFERLIEVDRQLDHHTDLAGDLAILANIALDRGRPSVGLSLATEALELARRTGHTTAEVDALSCIGYARMSIGPQEDGAAAYKEAIEIARQMHDERKLCVNLTRLGLIYWVMGKFEKCRGPFIEALTLAQKINNKFYEGQCQGNLGHYYLDRRGSDIEDVLEALDCYERADRIHGAIGVRRGQGFWKGQMGRCYTRLGRHEEAVESLLEAIDLHVQVDEQGSLSRHFWYLGQTYRRAGEYKKAIVYYLAAIEKFRETGYELESIQAEEDLAEFIDELGGEIRYQSLKEEVESIVPSVLAYAQKDPKGYLF